MLLFKALCRSPEGASTILEAVLEMADGATSYNRVALRTVRGATTDDHSYPLAQPISPAQAQSGSFEAQIAVADATAFNEFGVLGFTPDRPKATLTGVRIVVRPSDRDGGHSSEHPYFALYLDWTIEATVSEGARFSEGNVVAGARAQLVLTAGFSCIHPPEQAWKLGARVLQLRLDLDFLAATTGWFPLTLIDGGFGLPFAMPGLRDWFGKLADQAGNVALPDWTADFRLPALLPLGLRFKESHLALAKGAAGGYLLDARAIGLVLEWRGEPDFQYSYDGAEFSLRLADGNYVFTAVLFAAQYPAAEASGTQPPAKVGLPFGALTLSAEAWRITAGLVAHGTPVKVCPELVIEIAGVSLASELLGDDKPIWRSGALRLHLRGRSLLCCPVADPGKLLFEPVAAPNWLAAYRDAKNPRVLRLSGAAAADPQAEPEESFRIQFVDGAFDPGGHLSLLWKQDDARLFERLTRLVPGLKSEPAADGASAHYVALELACFDGPAGQDLQARLEWRRQSEAVPVSSAPPGPTEPGANEICGERVGDTYVLNLPMGGNVPPAPIPDSMIRLDLPLIEAAFARPAAQSLLFYRPAGEEPTLSLLHIHRKDAAAAVLPIVHASIDLSLADGDDRELLPTTTGQSRREPFLSIGLGSRAPVQALAVVSWRQGARPQILRAFEGIGTPFRPLIPAESEMSDPDSQDCAGCPSSPPPRPAPVALHPDRFGTPEVTAPSAGWSLAIQVAVKRALRSFLPQSDSAKSLIEFDVVNICYVPEASVRDQFLPPLRIETILSVNLGLAGAGARAITGKAVFRFDPSDMSLRLVEGGVFDLEMEPKDTPDWARKLEFPIEPDQFDYSEPISLFGLDATFYRRKKEGEENPAGVAFLTLDLRGGRFAVSLAAEAHCVLRYADLGGGALAFDVEQFVFGPGGLDVEAALIPSPLKVKGLMNPFQLESARLSMAGSRMRRLSVSASGKLPEILAFAPVSVTITLAQERAGGPIDLEELSCTLENGDEPIFTSGIRYRFEISALSLRYTREGAAGRHFFFEVTGAAQFQPETGEFDGGLLENLKSARVEFTRAPLSDEFTDHLTFIVELNEPVTFEVFKIFRMEIRSFGFAPKYDFPRTPRPALIIGGQCEFADIGDVVSAEIDFHRMYLGLPGAGETRPQVDFKNLRVEIRSAAGFRIGGTVATYDEDTRKGFKGDGFVAIPGFPQIGAAFAFMQLRHPGHKWKRAWFIALEASAISYQLTPLPIFLRQAGLGFGYRFTSVLLREQPNNQTLAELVEALLSALDEHQTLARIESWVEDLETEGGPRWSIAMEAVFTLGSSQPDPVTYLPEEEQKLRTIVLQTMAAMNLEGLVAGAKVWFPVSYDDFLNDRLAMRRRPMAKGFVHFSPRHQRLLAYARKEKNAYYGPPDDPLTDLAKTILEPTPFECAVLIEPGRVRGEIGWADRLVFPLELGPLKLECRGGILYAVEKGSAVYGIYFSARGGLGLSGGAGGGSLGLRLSAHAEVRFATRLMIAQPLLRPIGSSVYGQAGLDINVRFSVAAWFKFKVGFVKVHLSLSFSISLQVLVALEIGMADAGNLGFKARATVVIGVFGRRLRASIAVGVNDSAVDRARERLEPFMSSMLEPGKIPPVPGRGPGAMPEFLLAPSAADLALAAVPLALPWASSIELEPAANEPFAFAVIPVGPKPVAAGGARYWLLWIMPTPQGDGFYPVPAAEAGTWARLSGVPEGTKLHALDEEGRWAETTDLYCHPSKKFFPVDAEGGTSPSEAERLTLRKAIAGCWRPLDPGSMPDFPFDFKGDPKEVLTRVDPDPARVPQRDERVFEGPRYADAALNPSNDFDAALASAMSHATDTETIPRIRDLEAQALGNQAFLLSSFQEEIRAYVAATNGQIPAAPTLPDIPSVWDTGMVLLLEAAALPEWVRRRNITPCPKLTFASGEVSDLRPIVEPEAALLSDGNAQLKAPPVAHFDEKLLALSWRLGWRAGPPEAVPGIGTDVEDFLQHYRVELFDLAGGEGDLAGVGGGRPLAQSLVRPANLLARVAPDKTKPDETKLVELAPRYCLTIPVDEIFATAAEGQQVRRVLAVVTPIGQAGEEGEPFSIAATQKLRLTPLPADHAELSLVNEAGRFVGRLSWQEPALPNRAAIAVTDQWELILRRLPKVPLGHYPQTAGEASHESGAFAFDRNVRPGDLIVRMNKSDFAEPSRPEGHRVYELSLPDGLRRSEFKWLDHEGRELPGDANARLVQLKKSFMDSVSAADEGGHAWQLFLRARHEPIAGDTDFATHSSVTAVAMSALIGEGTGRADAAPGSLEGKRTLPLRHFEWPRAAAAIEFAAPRVEAGFLHVPLINFAESEAAEPQPDIEPEAVEADPDIEYCRSGDTRRVVSAAWSGFPLEWPGARPPSLAACAGFRFFEAVETGLTNRDVAARPGLLLRAFAKEIGSFDAVDPQLAGTMPNSLADTQNWLSWSPAQRSILLWLDKAGSAAAAGAADARRSWYSWSDAELIWPARMKDEPTEKPPVVGRANLHALLGRMLRKLKDEWADPEGYELETAAGKPDLEITTQLEWIERNTQAVDPNGWAALWHLGLAVELSARDRVTGEPAKQAVLRLRCEEILRALLLNDAELAPFAKHLALDCPLRPNAGLGAAAERVKLAELALDRIQIALRPIAVRRDEYCILSVPAGFRPGDAQAGPLHKPEPDEPGLYVRRLDIAMEKADFIRFREGDETDARERLIARLRPGSKWVLKFPKKLWPTRLKPWLAEFANPENNDALPNPVAAAADNKPRYLHVAGPLSLGSWKDGMVWPHGSFGDKDRTSLLVCPQAFVDHLKAAPLSPRPAGDLMSKEEEEDAELEKIGGAYPDWARRYFSGSPICENEAPPPFRFSNANTATAAHRSEAVEVLAPSRDGTYRLNRFVNWQWATTRSLRVTAAGRYDDLLRAMGARPRDGVVELSPSGGDANATPFHLARIRKVEPPQLLGERIVRGSDGLDYHELSAAIHEEDALQQANSALARQLEFSGTRMRLRRAFLFEPWAVKLKAIDEVVDPVLPSPKRRWIEEPGFAPSDATLLGEVPAVRFGATTMMIRCEPFFYGTTVELQAMAVAVESPLVERRLGDAKPDQPLPEGGPTLFASRQPLAWQDAMAARYRAWIDAFSDPPPAVVKAMTQWQVEVRLRFPRFFEGLRGDARKDEAGGMVVGALPDCTASVHISRRIAGADEPVCLLRPDRRDAPPAFELLELSPDLVSLDPVEFAGWADGIWLTARLRPRIEPSVVETAADAVAILPLARAQAESLFDPTRLPAWGSLANLAPLALRLLIEAAGGSAPARLRFIDPLPLPRFAALPLTGDTQSDLPPRTGELALGLRLLLDTERMAAAKAAAYLAVEPADLALRDAVEQAAGIACRKPPAEEIPAAEWQRWLDAGLALWGLKTVVGAARWTRLEAVPGDDIALLIACAPAWSESAEEAFGDVLELEPAAGEAVKRDVGALKAIAALSRKLTEPLELRIERARLLEPEAETISAWVQHGNEPRSYWGGSRG